MELLILSSLIRQPMHGYEIKMELQYKHVRLWAKADHGHLYATLTRLEKGGQITGAEVGADRRRTFTISDSGRARLLKGLEDLGRAEDSTHFDIDLFLSSSFALPQARVISLLAERRDGLVRQHAEAVEIQAGMSPYVPAVARLIIEHRVEHLQRELAFLDRVSEALRAQASWAPTLGQERIGDFIERTGAALENK